MPRKTTLAVACVCVSLPCIAMARGGSGGAESAGIAGAVGGVLALVLLVARLLASSKPTITRPDGTQVDSSVEPTADALRGPQKRQLGPHPVVPLHQ